MEPILVYGHPLGSSMGLIAAMEWLGQPYRVTRVDMLKDMHQPSYRPLNAREETPVLVTETGLIVSETIAILRWLALRDNSHRLSFASGSAQDLFLWQRIAFLNTGFTAAFGPYWAALEMEDAAPARRDTLRQFGHAQVNTRHAQLEAMMGDTPYLLGDAPSLADAVFVSVARWADFHEAIDAAHFPKIAALKQRLALDPAVIFATAIENGERPKGTGALQEHVPLSELLARIKDGVVTR